ncbi:MAG: hypothetical protein U0Z53_13000 [Blastocatellia bacterium]
MNSSLKRNFNRLLISIPVIGILTITGAATLTAAPQDKVMREYKGVRLGMKPEEVEAALGKPANKNEGSEEYKLSGDDSMTIYYDGGTVKTISLLFTEAKNAPAWTEVVGHAEVKTNDNGSKVARVESAEGKFWISMYQNKSGTMTTITISRT